MRTAAGWACASIALVACGAPAPHLQRVAPSTRAVAHSGERVGSYELRFRPREGVLDVEARLQRGGRLRVDDEADPFLDRVEHAPDDHGAWGPATREGTTFLAPSCAEGPCRIRYRFKLREACRRLDDLDRASEEGPVLEAPPSTWLLVPEGPPEARVRFAVEVPEGQSFVTGIPASKSRRAWDITLDDLATSPYSAFGPLRTRLVDVGDGAVVEMAIAPGKMVLTDGALEAWTKDAARAVKAYFGRFPLAYALLLLVPARGGWIGEGKTLAGGGGTIFMRIGEQVTVRGLATDWVLVHEMTHLAFPSLPRAQSWAEEGLATYVEPFARVRAGLLEETEAWEGLVDGLPNGEPEAGDKGLDHTHTWGRTYWGGALYWLLADVELRTRSKGHVGLDVALAGILAAGLDDTKRSSLDHALAVGDRATGMTVLTDLRGRMGSAPHPVDLGALLRSLGVKTRAGKVVFDDHAPLADVRRAIGTGAKLR